VKVDDMASWESFVRMLARCGPDCYQLAGCDKFPHFIAIVFIFCICCMFCVFLNELYLFTAFCVVGTGSRQIICKKVNISKFSAITIMQSAVHNIDFAGKMTLKPMQQP